MSDQNCQFPQEWWEKEIDRLVAHNTQLRKALIPFTHPDFRLRLGGNSPTEGADAIVFQRNSALLRLKDFDLAAEVTGHE